MVRKESHTLSLWMLALVLFWLANSAFGMTLGPVLIFQCPDSDKLIKVDTVSSGNTIGGIRWSDGYVKYPMLPSRPAITRCGDQGTIFWVADSRQVGSIDPWRGDATSPQWHAAETIRFLTEAECLDALDQGLGNTRDRALYLRVHAWWAANAPIRDQADPYKMLLEEMRRAKEASVATDAGGDADRRKVASASNPGAADKNPFELGTRARDNLERLVELLSGDGANERLQRADALRQLGRFDEASEVLKSSFPANLQDVVQWISGLVEQRNVLVKQFPSPRRKSP